MSLFAKTNLSKSDNIQEINSSINRLEKVQGISFPRMMLGNIKQNHTRCCDCEKRSPTILPCSAHRKHVFHSDHELLCAVHVSSTHSWLFGISIIEAKALTSPLHCYMSYFSCCEVHAVIHYFQLVKSIVNCMI